MKLLVVLLGFTLFLNPFFSQTPGYMGHKFQVQFEYGLMPNLNGRLMPEYSSNDKNSFDVFTLNSSLGLSLGYSISRKYNFVASFSHKKRSISFPYIVFEDYALDEYYLYFVNGGEAEVVNNKISFGFQKYKGDAIAPVGKYVEFGYALNVAFLAKDESLLHCNEIQEWDNSNYFYNIDQPAVVTNLENVKLGSLYLGFGKKRVYNNRMFLDVKFKFYMPLSFNDGNVYNEDADYAYNDLVLDGQLLGNQIYHQQSPYSYYLSSLMAQDYLKSRLRRFQFLNELYVFKIAVGYIF